MATASVENVRVAGLATAIPPLTRRDFDELGIPPDRMVRARAMKRRPVVRSARWDQCQSDFCHAAAVRLLGDLGWDPATIDVVVLVTLTPDYPIPATAIILQDRLGIPKTALAFDLPGGCATLLQALQLVAAMLSPGHLRRALLLCGEVSKIVEGPDSIQSIEHLCGHNGGVLALEHQPGVEPMYFHLGGDGSELRSFFMEVGGTRCPPDPAMFTPEKIQAADNPATYFTLDMARLQEAALRELPPSIHAVLAAARRPLAEIDALIVSPLGIDIEEALRRQLALRSDRLHGYTYEYGNGGSGSYLLALLARHGSRLQGGRFSSLWTGFGAGFAWGSALITTECVVCPEPIELA